MIKILVTMDGEDTGFCREYFRSLDGYTRYCLQEDACNKPLVPYICTADGEPIRQIEAVFEVLGKNDRICKCGHCAADHAYKNGDSHPSATERTGACGCVRSKEQAAMPENSQAYFDALAIGRNLDDMYLIGKNSRRLKQVPSQVIIGRIVGGERVDSGETAEAIAIALFGHSTVADHLLRVERGERSLTVLQFIKLCDAIGRDDEHAPSASDIFLRCHAAILMAESDWFVEFARA